MNPTQIPLWLAMTRVLVLTGNLVRTSEPELKALGADALCLKPVDARCLIDATAAPASDASGSDGGKAPSPPAT